mgnify:CR=1 FL=1
MKAAPDLPAIRRAIFEGRFDEAYQLCERVREKQGERTGPAILYAGAVALFGLGHVHQSEEWVEAHGEATRYSAEHLYLAAYLEIHKRQSERALLLWTRILQIDPSQTFADGLIARLRGGEESVLKEVRDPAAFQRYGRRPICRRGGGSPAARRLLEADRCVRRAGRRGDCVCGFHREYRPPPASGSVSGGA